MPIFCKYDGIDGDVTAEGHEKWIELSSCQFGVGRSITNSTAKGCDREASAPSVSEIVVTKVTDGASCKLFQASLFGEGKDVQIDFCKTDKDKLEPYLSLTLSNTLVSGFSTSSGGDRPSESLTLNFTKIEFKNTGMGSANETGSPESTSWDLAQAKGS
ncbi:MAG: Hcp family type VI secretion system effector [Isosphaeraceae bacterium]